MRLLSGCVCLLLLLLSSCSKKKEMKALMEQTLQEDQQEVVFRSDSTALLLIDYFIQHGTANEQMRAYYLLGRAYAHSSKLFNGNFDTSFSTLWFYSVFFNYVAIL